MSLNFNNIKYSCSVSSVSNKSTILRCSPQRKYENFQDVGSSGGPVIFYNNINYSGNPVSVNENGDYPFNGPIMNQIGNDSVNSIMVPNGVTVTIFSNDLDTGKSLVVTAPGIPDLSQVGDSNDPGFRWNNNMSSFRISGITNATSSAGIPPESYAESVFASPAGMSAESVFASPAGMSAESVFASPAGIPTESYAESVFASPASSNSNPTSLGWIKLSGIVSGSGGYTPSNIFTSDISNPDIMKLPIGCADFFQFIIICNEYTPEQVCSRAVNVITTSSSIIFTFDRNIGGSVPPAGPQSFWVKYVISDGTYYNQGRSNDEFIRFGIKDSGYTYNAQNL